MYATFKRTYKCTRSTLLVLPTYKCTRSTHLPTYVFVRPSFVRLRTRPPIFCYLYVGYKFKTASSTLPTLPTTLGCRLAARGIWSVIRVYVIVWLTGRIAFLVKKFQIFWPPKLTYFVAKRTGAEGARRGAAKYVQQGSGICQLVLRIGYFDRREKKRAKSI